MADGANFETLNLQISVTARSAADNIRILANAVSRLHTELSAIAGLRVNTLFSGISESAKQAAAEVHMSAEQIHRELERLMADTGMKNQMDMFAAMSATFDTMENAFAQADMKEAAAGWQEMMAAFYIGGGNPAESFYEISEATDQANASTESYTLTYQDLLSRGGQMMVQNGQAAASFYQVQEATDKMAASTEKAANAASKAGSSVADFSHVAKGVGESIGLAAKETKGYAQTSEVLGKVSKVLAPTMEAVGVSAEAFGGAMAALAGPIGAVVVAIQVVIKVVTFLVDQFNEFNQVCKKVIDTFKELKEKYSPFEHLKKELASLLALAKRQVLRRAINAVIRAVTEGLKTGIANLAEYDAEFGAMVQSVKNAAGLFRNSIGVAVAPIISYFIPAINALLAALTAAMNTFARLTALLTGKHTYTIAKSYEEIGESAGGASGKVKELQRTILGFDEINKLNGQNGSGGGGGGAAGDGISAYETMDVGDWPYDSWGEALLAFVQWLDTEGVPKLDKGLQKVAGAVNTFATNLADALTFDGVQEAISDLGTHIGETLNNFLNGGAENGGIDWAEIGRAFGASIKTIFNFAAGLITSIDFLELGSNIAKAANEALQQLDEKDIKNIADTIYGFLTAGIRMGVGFLLDFDFMTLANDLATFVNRFVENIVNDIANVKQKAWQELPVKIAKAISTFFDMVDWDTALGTLSRIVTYIINALKTILSELAKNKQFMNALHGFVNLIADVAIQWFFLKIRAAFMIGGQMNLGSILFGAMQSSEGDITLGGDSDMIYGALMPPTGFVSDVEDAAGAVEDYKGAVEGIGTAASSANLTVTSAVRGPNGIIGLMEKLPTESAKPISDFVGKVDSLRTDVVDDLSATRRDGATHLETLRSASNQKFDNMRYWATKHAEDLKTDVTGKFATVSSEAGTKMTEVRDQVVGKVNEAKTQLGKEKWTGIGDNIKNGLIDGMGDFNGKLDQWASQFKKRILDNFNIKSPSKWARDFVGEYISEGIAVGMENGSSTVEAACAGIKEGISSQFDDMTFFGNVSASTRGGSDIATAIGNQITSGIASMTTNENDRPIVCEVYLDRDRIATAVTRGQQAQNRRYSTTAMS